MAGDDDASSGDRDDIARLIASLGESDAPPSLKDRRRAARSTRWSKAFGSEAEAALDLLAVADLAWHDCYAEMELPGQVLDDLFDTSRGNLVELVHMVNLALIDWRDLRVNADEARSS